MTAKMQSLILTLFILFALLFALIRPMNKVAMRRESDRPIPVKAEIVLSLDQALNLSLAYGDYRRVNVNWAEVGL